MEIFFIVLGSFFLTLLIALIKFILRNVGQGFSLKKDHFWIILAYLISSVLLGTAFYYAFGIFFIIGAFFGGRGIEYYGFLLFCFGIPQFLLIPLFGYFFFRDLPKKEVNTSLDSPPPANARI